MEHIDLSIRIVVTILLIFAAIWSAARIITAPDHKLFHIVFTHLLIMAIVMAAIVAVFLPECYHALNL